MYVVVGKKSDDGLLLKDFSYMAYDDGTVMEHVTGDYVMMEELPPEYPGEVDTNYVYQPYINLTTMSYDFEAIRKPITHEQRIEQLEKEKFFKQQQLDELSILILQQGGALLG